MSRKTENDNKKSSYIQKEKKFIMRTRRVKIKYQKDTKQITENAIDNLERLAAEAHERATSKYLPTETRQKWARIEAQVYLALNALLKTYDSQKVMEKMEELTEIVEKLMEKDQKPGEEHRET